MSYAEEISRMSKSGYSDIELLEYINEHFDEIECELYGEEYKEPKHDRNLCIDCNVVKTIDCERSTLVCTKCLQQHQFRHMTFPPCTHQSHTICLSLELLHLYTTHSRGEMEVTDIPTSKLRVERGIS